MARIIGHTRTKVRIELRLDEADWARLQSQYPNEGQALRAVRVLFEDAFRVALVAPGQGFAGCQGSGPPDDRRS